MSELCLGTAQLGMKYGIKNALNRKPTEEESFAILRKAQERGIHYLDTASAYGEAETLLGRFGIENEGFRVISKLRPELEEGANASWVQQEIKASLQRLKVKRLYGYILHRVENLQQAPIMNGMMAAKKMGVVQKIGVSVYEPEDALNAARDERIDIIQIPYNALDRRLDIIGFFSEASRNHKEVFARSPFLQGLLLMNLSDVRIKLPNAYSYVQKFQEIAVKYSFSPGEAAFLCSYCHPYIQYVLFGVDTIQQLNENLQIITKAEHFHDCYFEIMSEFTNVPVEILNPSLW